MTEFGQAKEESTKVNIHGVEYTIAGKINPEYVQRLAKYVDEKMWEIAESNALTSDTKIAVLAALNIANELFSLKEMSFEEQEQVTEKTRSLLAKIEELI
jgi:cell division protein ZapA